jgi:D-arabinose 1-dehydrogenase-like Zn-dependent alcohol dehydrogenase
MKAVIMTAPAMDGSTTSVADIDEPQPGPGQVAIDVACAGVNFIDVMARRGDPGYASAWPYVPGLEVAGTIRSVGGEVRDLHPGQRVAAFTPGGGMAEAAVAAADVTVEVPPDVPLGIAASAPLVVSTALLLLADRARIRPGESVLMHSASGGVGSVVSQVAAALGSGRRIGTVGRRGTIAAGLAAGWDDVFAREAGLAEAVRAVAAWHAVSKIRKRLVLLLIRIIETTAGDTWPGIRRHLERTELTKAQTDLLAQLAILAPRQIIDCNPRHQGRRPRRPNAPKPRETPHPASRNAAPAPTRNPAL